MQNTIENLSQIQAIRLRIKYSRTPVIVALHKFIFEEEGDYTQKHRIRNFKGFACEERVPNRKEKFEYVNEKLTETDLINCCKILGLEQEGTKKKIFNRIFNGLMDINTLASAVNNISRIDTEEQNLEMIRNTDQENNGEQHKRTDREGQNKNESTGNTNNNVQLHITDEMEVSIQPFNGNDTYPVERWITDIENVATLLQLTEEQKLMLAKILLTGLAQMWIKEKSNIETWENLKTILTELSNEIKTNQLHEDLAKRKIRENERVQNYYAAMKKLAQDKIKPETLIQYVINGIEDDTNNKTILYGATDLKDFAKKLKLYKAVSKKE